MQHNRMVQRNFSNINSFYYKQNLVNSIKLSSIREDVTLLRKSFLLYIKSYYCSKNFFLLRLNKIPINGLFGHL